MQETITIPKIEYERLKKLEKVDHDLIAQLVESLEDAKCGRIRRVAWGFPWLFRNSDLNKDL